MRRHTYILLLALLATCTAAYGQGDDDCPGFRNTVTFVTGDDQYFWSARVGERCYPQSSTDTTTGYYVMSTCASSNAQEISAYNILSTSYNSGNDGGGGITCCGHGSLFDASDKRFQIYTQENAGLDQFTISIDGSGMQRIPPGMQTSIRLGDPRASGSCSQTHTWSSSSSNKGSEALFYTMTVTPYNSLLLVYYAVVGRCYSHTAREAGEFLIRVVKQNADGTWPNSPINDSLWFKVSAPAIPTNGIPVAPWVSGRPGTSCGSTTCAYVYKPWTRVAISLDKYVYSTVRVEMYTSDCIYDVDPIYAYISGDYQAMTFTGKGCPDPESNVIDTLEAPSDMISYQWFVSTEGPEENIYDRDRMDTVPFRQLTEVSTDNSYTPTVDDFILTSGEHAGDTVGRQTFMCIMTSAMNPSKPFTSRLYGTIENLKPVLRYTYESDCSGLVTFTSTSMTFSLNGLDEDSTYWAIYTDTTYTELIDTLHGRIVNYRFQHGGVYGAMLHCTTAGEDCSSIEHFPCVVKDIPPCAMEVSSHVLCDGERLTLQCTEGVGMAKTWTVGDSVYASTDEDVLDMLQREMPVGVFPISLTVRNADGCERTVYDEVIVYGTPVLSAGASTGAICEGESVTISAAGSMNYNWQSSPWDSTLDGQQNSPVITVTPSQTTIYSLPPVADNPCSDKGVDVKIEVIPYPIPKVKTNRSRVTYDDPEITFTDVSPQRYSTTWRYSDGITDEGSPVKHQFGDFDVDSVEIYMRTCNRLGCCSDTTIALPVGNFSVWFPNAFAPGQDANNRFGIISSEPLYDYEIWIYNRWGLLVHKETDATKPWDGTDLDGKPCPQGAYAYFYRYATSAETGYHDGSGTVTLIR